jgi:hypothetical protein
MTPDEQVDALERQQLAAGLHSVFEERVLELESEILRAMIAQYNAGTLSDSMMRGQVGGLAALRTLLKRIDRELEVSTTRNENSDRAGEPAERG